MKLTQEDLQQIKEIGLSEDKIHEQLEIFKRGNIPVDIEAAATVGNGIRQYSEEEKESLANFYESRKNDLDIIKFVPASGAATRMFKALHLFLDNFDPQKESLESYLSKSENSSLETFFKDIEKLPFYENALNNARESQPGFDSLSPDAKKYLLVKTMLFSPGLDLSNYPKGLVPFHNYKDYVATAFEEHLCEAAEYAEVNGVAKLHFTVSPDHQEKFEAEFERIRSRVEKQTQIKFEITYSHQDPKTDTIAANDKNEPFRTEDNKMFFRPGGHGALIENLNNQDADVAFIKNIDNVVVASRAKEVAKYKKMLAGKLLQLQEECFLHLNALEDDEITDEEIIEIEKFVREELFTAFAKDFKTASREEKITQIRERLNRPLRVCGMVKNEGEPGGGPFLVNMQNGTKSLQIIEGAQIDEENPQQKEIAQNATHFNPVDLVCGLRDYAGDTFDLTQYVDPSTSFVANKTKDGKPLKALELPGLWNGAMAQWNTVFVEVPVQTFNPVKTVADLLKPSHQVD